MPVRPIVLLCQSRRRALVLLAVAVLQASCGAGWRVPASPWAQAWPPRQQVQVWQGDRALQLHGVVVTADSVSGIHYLKPLTCDSCRVVLPRRAVDSLRVGNPTGGLWRSTGLAFGLLFGLAFVACARAGSCNYGD